jgi:hypothetical protein
MYVQNNNSCQFFVRVWNLVSDSKGRAYTEGVWEQDIDWGIEWIQLAQDRDRWRAFVNTAMNLWGLAPRT